MRIFWLWLPGREAHALVFSDDHYQQVPVLWCTERADFPWSRLRTHFAVLSPQDVPVCSFSYPLDKKWGTLLYSRSISENSCGTSMSLWWEAKCPSWALPGWLQLSHWSVTWVVLLLFPVTLKISEFPWPRQEREVQGLSLLFIWDLCSLNVLAAREGIQNPTQGSHVELEFCLPRSSFLSKADLHLSDSWNNLWQTSAVGSSLQCS